MNRTLIAFPFFIAISAAMITFNVVVLELGDTKFANDLGTALKLYLPIWLIFFAPHMIFGWLILSIKINTSKNQKIAVLVLTVITLILLEISFIFNLKYIEIGIELIVTILVSLGLRFWLKSSETYEKA